MRIAFDINLDGDSEANLTPESIRKLESYHPVMVMDWCLDMMADISDQYDAANARLYARFLAAQSETMQ